MKKLLTVILIFVLLFGILTGCGEKSERTPLKGDSRKIIAEKYVDAIFAEDFKALSKFQLSVQMRFNLLTKNQYKKVKQVFIDACGELIKRVDAIESEQGDYRVVSVASEFEKTYADINVVFNKNNSISGIHYIYNRIYEDMDEDERLVLIGSEYPLSGALAVPESENLVPAVIIVHGSGPSDRNGASGGNAVYLDIAKQLYNEGIASLRYDKRTYVYKNMPEGHYDNLTVWEETIDDVVLAYELLRTQEGIDPDKIFIAGHSLGGYLMPRIANALPDAAGFIMLAPSASHLEDLIVRQTEYINNLDGNVSKQEKDALAEFMVVRDRIKILKADSGYKSYELFWAPESYWLDLQDYSPVNEMQSEDRPILIVQGGRDYQVDLSEFDMWQNGLKDNVNTRFVMIPELNHMLAFGVEKSVPTEYQELSEVDQRVGEELADFIFNRK